MGGALVGEGVCPHAHRDATEVRRRARLSRAASTYPASLVDDTPSTSVRDALPLTRYGRPDDVPNCLSRLPERDRRTTA
jgi:hypothetical protein